jgi:hypothetical protein
MGLRAACAEGLATVLMRQYREHTTKVRQVYDKLFYGDFFDAGEDASRNGTPWPLESKPVRRS